MTNIVKFPLLRPRLVLDTKTVGEERLFTLHADRWPRTRDGEIGLQFVEVWEGADYGEALGMADVLQRSINYGYRFIDRSGIGRRA